MHIPPEYLMFLIKARADGGGVAIFYPWYAHHLTSVQHHVARSCN